LDGRKGKVRTFVLVLQVISALGLIATVLLQSGKSAGLSGSIAGGAETLFGGSKKGLNELFSKLSTGCAVAFMILTLILSIL
jgi:preprotein translocase subunit SecG